MRTPVSAPPRVAPLAEMLDAILDASRAADAAHAELARAEAAYLREPSPGTRLRFQAASRAALASEVRFEVTWRGMVQVGGGAPAPRGPGR